MRRGWLVRTGDGFSLSSPDEPSHRLRLTVHDLADPDADQFVADLAAAVR